MEPLIFKTIVKHSDFGKAVVFYHLSEGKLYRWLNQDDPDSGLRWAQVPQFDVQGDDINDSCELEFLVLTGTGWERAMELLKWAKLIHVFEGRDRGANEA